VLTRAVLCCLLLCWLPQLAAQVRKVEQQEKKLKSLTDQVSGLKEQIQSHNAARQKAQDNFTEQMQVGGGIQTTAACVIPVLLVRPRACLFEHSTGCPSQEAGQRVAHAQAAGTGPQAWLCWTFGLSTHPACQMQEVLSVPKAGMLCRAVACCSHCRQRARSCWP
jgi:hypothetical protein